MGGINQSFVRGCSASRSKLYPFIYHKGNPLNTWNKNASLFYPDTRCNDKGKTKAELTTSTIFYLEESLKILK